MSNFMFNIAKGRGVEYYNRVKANDPANSALILVPLSASGKWTLITTLPWASRRYTFCNGSSNH